MVVELAIESLLRKLLSRRLGMNVTARVALRYRLAHRYLSARGLPLGKTFQSELVRIWHGREVIKVTDLKNAGKRGKTCSELTLQLTYNFKGDRLAWFDEVADAMLNHASRGYEGVSGYARFLQSESPADVAIDVRSLKSINVEPYGESFEFTIKQPNGGGIEVKSSPIEFRVTNRHWFEGPPGKPGFFQDTSYWPRKKKDAMTFYAWMKENHQRARRFMNLDMFRKLWGDLGISYDSH